MLALDKLPIQNFNYAFEVSLNTGITQVIRQYSPVKWYVVKLTQNMYWSNINFGFVLQSLVKANNVVSVPISQAM